MGEAHGDNTPTNGQALKGRNNPTPWQSPIEDGKATPVKMREPSPQKP